MTTPPPQASDWARAEAEVVMHAAGVVPAGTARFARLCDELARALDTAREQGRRDRDAEVAKLRAEVERLRGADSPYPVLDVLRKLADAADHLHAHHDCDTHGWEVWREAARWARIHDRAIESDAHIPPEKPDAE